jgi:bifunctional NMN adenylyltransferase/nudix hydrolase
MKKYNRVVFIGRFQPLHSGHIDTIHKAFEYSDEVVVLVGSSNRPRSIDNPFTFKERQRMILSSIKKPGLVVYPINDYKYNDYRWEQQVLKFLDSDSAIIGHKKDDSTYYIDLFDDYDHIDVENYDNLNSTDLRYALYNGWVLNVNQHVHNVIKNIDLTQLREEYKFIQNYKKDYESLKFPPIFVTTSVLITYNDFGVHYALLIKRKRDTGIGLYALPGGFLDANDKDVLHGALRELKEETGVDLDQVMHGIQNEEMYDQLNRSHRGRMITFAYHYEVGEKPNTVAGDDAASVEWVKIKDIDSCNMYSDHYDIIDDFLDVDWYKHSNHQASEIGGIA